jgi:nucleotide-binding universal stress UspA family protein
MKIMLAVDGSECADIVVEEAIKRPWPPYSAFRILSVAETLPSNDLPLSPYYLDDIENAARQRARSNVERAAARLRESGVRSSSINSKVVVDSPKDAIVEEAERWGADLILVGPHGYQGPARALFGSVSQAVASLAKCSVEIVRRRRSEAGGE